MKKKKSVLLLLIVPILLMAGCKKEDDSVCREELMGTWIVTYERMDSPDFSDWGGASDTIVAVSYDTTEYSVIYTFSENSAKSEVYKNNELQDSDLDPVSYTCSEVVNEEPLVSMNYFWDSEGKLRLETQIGVKSSDPDYPNPNEVRYVKGTLHLIRQ